MCSVCEVRRAAMQHCCDEGWDHPCRDDVLPCRAYLRHCILASKNLSPEAHASFMDHTYLVIFTLLSQPFEQREWLSHALQPLRSSEKLESSKRLEPGCLETGQHCQHCSRTSCGAVKRHGQGNRAVPSQPGKPFHCARCSSYLCAAF